MSSTLRCGAIGREQIRLAAMECALKQIRIKPEVPLHIDMPPAAFFFVARDKHAIHIKNEHSNVCHAERPLASIGQMSTSVLPSST